MILDIFKVVLGVTAIILKVIFLVSIVMLCWVLIWNFGGFIFDTGASLL